MINENLPSLVRCLAGRSIINVFKSNDLLRPEGKLIVIDVGSYYFMFKFDLGLDYLNVLQDGP